MDLKPLFLAAAVVATSACQSFDENKYVNEVEQLTPSWQLNAFKVTDVETPADLFKLSPQQEQHFFTYYNDPAHKDVLPNLRLANYLEDLMLTFSYAGDTLKAQDVVGNRYGNCLSLALLTTAFAKLVGLDVKYQQVHTPPLYRRIDGILTTSTHVRSVVLGPKPERKGDIIFTRKRVIIDYFPSRLNDRGNYISEADFISMYYQNKSAEVLGKNPDLAYSYIAQAMKLNTANASTLNTLAVLYRSNGYSKEARALYEFAIENDIESVHTLSNFAVLLKKVGDMKTLAKIGDMYLKADDDNPYRWVDLGDAFLARGNLSNAETFFNKAIAAGPYLSEGYSGLAKVYFMQGKMVHAESMMEKAVSLTLPSGNRELYTAKLNAIQNSR